ncbi:DUF6460 domain-containing protein [Pelagibacterium xiamenense]|uniref:DUF6460 domain-containing protein n=1 Tax=Pelagibacterium xiamenense TaxID=2901140 RepID=UPI001E2A8E70|nr:DUF6460 domain-containing protein [Pelagibacterium xiamenense]MCD7059075.1 DUF6460 domain-containing protein [Pelagibacterium xiamenense]
MNLAESFNRREPRSGNGLTALLGDTPSRVFIRLVLLSLLVGFMMAIFGVSPEDLLRGIQRMVSGLFDDGFAAFRQVAAYILTGAVIVVPIWIVLRILAMGKKR